MKRLSVPAVLVLTAAFFTACVQDTRPRQRQRDGGFVRQPSAPIDSGPQVTNDDNPPTPPPNPGDQGAAPTVPPPVKNYEYGKKVPGKPGFVTSPYAPAQGYVDVREFPPGTEVKDPYTGKIFLVP
jgi:hypothetical protein